MEKKTDLPQRRYEKGERRLKHVGTSDVPEFQTFRDNPKRVIGKCPKDINDTDRDRLLNSAVPSPNQDRDLPVPKKIYAVYRGAIYEAQTSDHGQSYHAYPFRGRLSGRILRQLEEMATAEGCEEGYKHWVRRYIVVHGQ